MPANNRLTVTALEHKFARGGVGLVAIWESAPDEGQRLQVSAEATAGVMGIDDSHVLRNGLGPMPNIRYSMATVSGRLAANYELRIAQKLWGRVGAGVFGRYGPGRVVFAASSAAPFAPLPATFSQIGADLSAGLSGQF